MDGIALQHDIELLADEIQWNMCVSNEQRREINFGSGRLTLYYVGYRGNARVILDCTMPSGTPNCTTSTANF
jgi:hypothetical protein